MNGAHAEQANLSMRQGSHTASESEDFGNHCSSGDYYSDSELLQHSHRYGICILTLVHACSMQPCNINHTWGSALDYSIELMDQCPLFQLPDTVQY